MGDLWNEYGADILASAVDYFASFLEEPDKEIVKKWVEEIVPANEMFLEDMEDGDFIDNEALGDPFPKFYEAFSPDTSQWARCCGLLIDLGAGEIKEIYSDEEE